MVLTEDDKTFLKDLSRQLVVRSYFINRQRARENHGILNKLKRLVSKPKLSKALVIDILDVLSKRHTK